jgi:L-cysteine S-thiosulfotransferase
VTRGFGLALVLVLAGTAAWPAELKPGEQTPRSGSDFATPGLRQMQQDDFANPGMLWVEQGQALWTQKPGGTQKPDARGRSCADCHGAIASMAGIEFPRRDKRDPQRLVNLELQVEQCRTERQASPAFGYESPELLALTAAIRHAARGQPAKVAFDADAIAAGDREYRMRRGQFDLACAQCHIDRAGKQLRDETISQGQSNGFPAYRVRWQSLGSLHRRFQACNNAVGAEPSELGAQDYVALEWFLAWRGRALPVETPAVRQ